MGFCRKRRASRSKINCDPVARYALPNFHKSFRYIGHDDEFAVARVMLKTVGRSGPPLAANVLDTMTVFHQEDGEWKYWSNHILGVDLLK